MSRISSLGAISDAQRARLERQYAPVARKVVAAVGKPGAQGKPGRDGKPGAQGKPGRDGKAGRDGIDGFDGTKGKPGAAGKPGKRGAAGPAGKPGKRGGQGVAGKPGANGKAGAAGAPGKPGSDGKAGSDGAPGQRGSIWISAPRGPRKAEGQDLDMFLDEQTCNVYQKRAGRWVILTCIRGPAGRPAPQTKKIVIPPPSLTGDLPPDEELNFG